MNKFKIYTVFFFLLFCTTIFACKYTIREIGFSTLSKVTYVLYRIDDTSSFFSKQLENKFAESNVVGRGLNLKADANNPIIKFAKSQKLIFPAFVLAAPDGRMIVLSKKDILNNALSSPAREQLLNFLPAAYASVILIDGKNMIENQSASELIDKTCERIENILPNMPKQVDVGPNMIRISNEQFDLEKVMLWSFGINEIPDQPMALVVYGKGRIMGEKISYAQINDDIVYKYLSIIGADCECGLDRKWMLGYQMPLNWPKTIRQNLSNNLGFDVDNPMVLTEMSRILSIENKVASDPDGVSFEPLVFDLDKEFGDIPEVEHEENLESTNEFFGTDSILFYSLLIFISLILVGAYIILKKKH